MIFITGAPRSGTSLVCQVLHALGVDFGGPLVGSSPWNPHGFFEHRAFRDHVLKPTLMGMGCDRSGQRPLPPRVWTPSQDDVKDFRSLARVALGTAQAAKDAPKLLLLWPLVKEAFPDARWVFVWRDPEETATSCWRAPFMRIHGSVDGWLGYVREIHDRMQDTHDHLGADDVEPDPCRPESFRGMTDAMGLTWDEGAVRRVLDPSIWGRP